MKTQPIIHSLTAISLSALLFSCEQKQWTNQSTSTETSTETTTPVSTDAEPPCCSQHEAPAAVEVGEDSIYQLESQWQDSSGTLRSLKSLGGQIQVVTMGYTTCKYACPRLLADMRQIESSLPEDVRGKTHFTFISIDPEHDTPSQLAAYRKQNKITSPRWTVLTGDSASVQELAVVLGIQYRKSSETDFAHSNIITVLDPNGNILHRQEGLGSDPSETIKAITHPNK